MVTVLVILVGWFLLSFPFAVVVGRSLRASGVDHPSRSRPPVVDTPVPPRQRGSGSGSGPSSGPSAGPRAA